MDTLFNYGFGNDIRYPFSLVPEAYQFWQIQNYIDDKLNADQKAKMIAHIMASTNSEEIREKTERELDRIRTERHLSGH